LRTSCREAAAWIGRVGSDTAGDDDDDDDDDGLKDFRQKLFASIRIYPFIELCCLATSVVYVFAQKVPALAP